MIATVEMMKASAAVAASRSGTVRARVMLPSRQMLRPDELVGAINRMLASRPDCEGLEVEAGELAAGYPDADGCNWRAQGLRLRVAHGPSTRALAGVHQAIELARLRYELLDG